MNPLPSFSCECCNQTEITRRSFLKAAAVGLASAGVGSLPLTASEQTKQPAPTNGTSETLVATLYRSLTDESRRTVLFPFDHPLRSKVDNNWHITPQRVGKDFTRDQQEMIREIFLKMHSPEYAQKVLQQVEHDAGEAGFGACSIA